VVGKFEMNHRPTFIVGGAEPDAFLTFSSWSSFVVAAVGTVDLALWVVLNFLTDF
jgi:hypothetical protein